MTAYIDAHRGRFGVEPICRCLGVSASAYHYRKTGRRSTRTVEDERLVALIHEVHLANYEAYSSRKTWKWLRRAGHRIGRDRIARVMRQAGIRAARGRARRWQTTQADLVRKLPDLVERHFRASGSDELWVADFTYLRSCRARYS
jgi:putative transposase